MQKPAELLNVGFPEFWKTIHGEYRPVFEETERLMELANALFRKPVSEPLHAVLRLIAQSASNSFGAVIILVLNGYGSDAMRLVRSMIEAEIVAHYLAKHPEEVKPYINHITVAQQELIEAMRRYTPEALKRIGAEAIRRTATAAASVQKRSGKRRKRWTAKTVKQMADEIQLGELYDTVYAWASSMHHVDIFGLAIQTDGTLAVEPAPSEKWTGHALLDAHASFLRILRCYSDAAGLGMDEALQTRERAFRKVWQAAKLV